jgi:hypothetical protein
MKKKIILPVLTVFGLMLSSCNKIEAPVNSTAISIVSENITSNTFNDSFNFIVISDWGWNGYKNQQPVADQMEKISDSIDAEFFISCGDNFQVNGVSSDRDPLWITNFENVYKGLSLMKDWYPVLGNHDYKGSAQAQIDYSKISRRWRMSEHYYTFSKEVNDSVSARFIFLDTPPLVSKYHNTEYPEIAKQDTAKEMQWLKDVLANSKEQWILVFGHHPIHSASQKHGNTPEMIARVKPLLEKYNARFYFSGHDHDFQHLHEKGQNLEYIVTGTGGDVRPASTNEMSLFSRSEPGFSIVSFRGDSIRIFFTGMKGDIIYSFGRSCQMRK